MLLKEKSHNHMIEIDNMMDLVNLNCRDVAGRSQDGEEAQDIEKYNKDNLVFLSGEELPQCWKDPHYRDKELER